VYFETPKQARRVLAAVTLNPSTKPKTKAVKRQNGTFLKIYILVGLSNDTIVFLYHLGTSTSTMSNEENLQEPLIERSSASPEPASPAVCKKRKRNLKETSAGETPAAAGKKKKEPKTKTVEEDELDLEAGINNAFSHMDSQLLADYVAQRTRRYESDLSSIELEDKYIPGMYCTP
jgi:hypothetical protein